MIGIQKFSRDCFVRDCCLLALTMVFSFGGNSAAVATDLLFQKYCDEKASNSLVLIDVTTKYDETDQTVLVDTLKRIFDKRIGGERITIRTIADSFTSSKRLLDACVPYCPEMTWWDELWSSCTKGRLAQERQELAYHFRSKLVELVSKSTELAHSDIVRTIAQALREERFGNGPRRVYIFSDMIENSSGFISSRNFFSNSVAHSLAKVDAAQLLPNKFPGIKIAIFGFGRSQVREQGALTIVEAHKLKLFWEGYFSRLGARKGSLVMNQNLVYVD